MARGTIKWADMKKYNISCKLVQNIESLNTQAEFMVLVGGTLR